MHRIGVFARRPVPGEVKTRLSPALPARLAAELYAALLADTFAAAAAASADERWAWWADLAAEAPTPDWVHRIQSGADLGERLAHALAAMRPGSGDRALVIGSDAPTLRSHHLDSAFAALATHDLVLGPATDGGYWLVGASCDCAAVFRDVPWSDPRVLEVTLERAAAAGLRAARLATLADLDEPADLARLLAGSVGDTQPEPGVNTLAALRRMALLP